MAAIRSINCKAVILAGIRYQLLPACISVLMLYCNLSTPTFGATDKVYRQPALQNLTTEDGLPSNEVYQVIQDKKGYLWFATDKGIARYNGHEFKTYGIEEGLRGVSVFGFTFDRFDKLWCYTYQREIYYLENEKFHRHPVSDQLKNLDDKIFHIYWQQDTLWIIANLELFRVYPSGKLDTMSHLTSNSSFFSIYQLNDSTYAPLLPSRKCDFHGVVIKNGDHIERKVLKEPVTFHNLQAMFMYGGRNDNGYLCHGESLLHWNADTIEAYNLDNRANHALYADPFGKLWVGTDKGALVFNSNDISKPITILLPDKDVTYIYRDRENGYWFTTEGEGVFYAVRPELRKLHANENAFEKRLWSMCISGNYLYHNNYKGGVYMTNLVDGTAKLVIGKLSRWNLSAPQDKDNEIHLVNHYIQNYHNIYSYKNYRTVQIDSIQFITQPYSHNIFLRNDSVLIYPHKENKDHLIKFPKRSSWYYIYYNNDQYLYLGDQFGLLILDHSKGTFPDSLPEEFDIRITDVTGRDSLVMIGTSGNGVLVCKGLKIINHIRQQNGLPDNLCNNLFLDDDGKLWVSTNKGLSLITNPAIPGQYKIKNLTVSDGLPSKQVLKCVVDNGWVAVGTPLGIVYFKEKEFEFRYPDFPVYLSQVEINREPYHELKVNELSYWQNNLFINYEAVTFQYRRETIFRHRLIGLDSNWRYTRDYSVQYNQLPPGEYSFQVQGGTLYNGWNQNSTDLSFHILPPFWERWWFIMAAALLIISSVFLLFYWRIGVISKRQRIKNRLFFYRQQAMGLQLNPHFFFNSIASIQAHILDNDQKSLLKHLAGFAKLIRMIFDLSRKNLVSLEEELMVLRQYLEFEKLRFKEKLTFHFEIDPDLESDQILVPPLLVQPIVENAVKHGRDEKEGKVAITIKVKKTDTSVIFEIEDSGKGYSGQAGTSEQKIGDHISAGLNLVQRRIRLLQEWLGKPSHFHISDPEAGDDGTRVSVTIPIVKKQLT